MGKLPGDALVDFCTFFLSEFGVAIGERFFNRSGEELI